MKADATDDGRGSGRLARGLIHPELTRPILGAFYSVYSEVGFGFLEAVYANCLSMVLEQAGLRVDREVRFQVFFRGRIVGVYRADLVVESRVVVEIKAGRSIAPAHLRQLRNYLRASNLQIGLLLNFGEKPEFRRVVCTGSHPRSSL